MVSFNTLTPLLVTLALANACLANDDGYASVAVPLQPRSPAPAFKPEKWLKGEPVASFETGKVHIVECWATWCGPCLAMIPHMNDLHNKFKDRGLVVIGVNVGNDTEEKATDFVTRKGDKMAYRVAYEGKTGQVSKDWLQAAQAKGIPHSFVVRDGKILWHGHPMELTEANVEAVLSGGTMKTTSPAEKDKLNEALGRYRAARLEILALLRGADTAKTLAKIAEHETTLASSEPSDPDLLRAMAFSVKGDKDQSLGFYRKAVIAAKDNPGALFRIAHGLLDYGTVRDNALALQCARAAVEKDNNVILRHMLARAELAAGNKSAAIAILEKIVEDDDSAIYRETLRELKENGSITPPR